MATRTENVPSVPIGEKLGMKTRVVRGVFWSLLGMVGHRVLGAISSVAIARILGPRIFGQYAMVHSTVQLFTAFAGFRLGSTSTKYIAEFRETNPQKAGRILGLVLVVTVLSCGFFALLMFLMSDWLANTHLEVPDLKIPIAIGAGYLFLMMVGNVLLRTLAGFEEFRSIAIIGIVRGVASILICIAATYFWGLVGAVVGLILTSAIAAVHTGWMIWSTVKKNQLTVPLAPREVFKEWSILSSFAIPAMLTGFVLVGIAWQGRAMLIQSSNGEFELGVFSAADQLRLIVMFIPNAIGNVMLPVLSKFYGDADQGEFESAMTLNLLLAIRIALPTAMLGIAISSILVFAFGDKFANAGEVIPVVMLAVFIYSLNQASRQAFTSTGRIWTNLIMHVISAIVFLIGCAYLIPRFGAIGFAWVHVISDGLLLVMQLAFSSAFIVQSSIRKFISQIILGVAAIGIVIFIGGKYGETSQNVVATIAMIVTGFPALMLAYKERASKKQVKNR